MSMNSQGRPTAPEPNRRAPIAPGTHTPEELATISGDRGLDHEEALIFELGHGAVGVDLPDVNVSDDRLGGLRRQGGIGLPGLSEPEVIRHYVRLSRMNYAIDSGLYPLGSCTMKHNPRLNEKMARLPGFGDLHPLAPQSTTQGALELIAKLMTWLEQLTGMPAVAMSPKAGAHGELCGLLAIRAAIAARGETRPRILVPESAHGTNPATAAFAGFTVDSVPGKPDGRVDAEALKAEYEAKAKAASEEAQSMLVRAKTDAEAIVAKAEVEAKALVERRQAMAETKIAAEERAAVDELRARAAKAATAAAAKLIADGSDAKSDKALVDQAIAGL